MQAGAAAQDLETKIEEEREKRRLSLEYCTSQYSSSSSITDEHPAFDLDGITAALEDVSVTDFPLIAWDFEQDVQ